MKKLFVFLLLCLCYCLSFGLSVEAKNIKFIQVTDIHMTQNNVEALQKFVDDINGNYSNLDFIIFTGDNIDKANANDLNLFLDTIKKIHIKKYVLMGNHDLMKNQDMSKEYYMKTVKKKLGIYHSGKPNYVFKDGKIVFLVMNGVKEVIPSPNGYFRKSELDWMDKKLTKYKNHKVVIVQHFPLFETRVKGHELYKQNEYMDVLNKHNNVIAIISGHYHQNREEMRNGIYYITTMNFANNKFYKLIEINDEDGFIFTTLIQK